MVGSSLREMKTQSGPWLIDFEWTEPTQIIIKIFSILFLVLNTLTFPSNLTFLVLKIFSILFFSVVE